MAWNLTRKFLETGFDNDDNEKKWVYYNGGSFGGDEIDESEDWQKGIFSFLCAAYALVSIVALEQLFRIQLRVPEYGWTTQKVFHLMNFIVNGLRAILFGLCKSVFLIKPKALECFWIFRVFYSFRHIHCSCCSGLRCITRF